MQYPDSPTRTLEHQGEMACGAFVMVWSRSQQGSTVCLCLSSSAQGIFGLIWRFCSQRRIDSWSVEQRRGGVSSTRTSPGSCCSVWRFRGILWIIPLNDFREHECPAEASPMQKAKTYLSFSPLIELEEQRSSHLPSHFTVDYFLCAPRCNLHLCTLPAWSPGLHLQLGGWRCPCSASSALPQWGGLPFSWKVRQDSLLRLPAMRGDKLFLKRRNCGEKQRNTCVSGSHKAASDLNFWFEPHWSPGLFMGSRCAELVPKIN